MSFFCAAAFFFPGLPCPARRQPSHCLPSEAMLSCHGLHPAVMGSALLSWAPPCCHGLCPAVMGSALLPCLIPCSPVYVGVVRAAMVMVACLCSGGLSVMVGCLGNGRLHQQWQRSSIGVECLGNGGHPSPSELHHPGFRCACRETLNPERFQMLFCFCGGGTRRA